MGIEMKGRRAKSKMPINSQKDATIIKTNGGDVALNNSFIDKRTGNVIIEEEKKKRLKTINKLNHGSSFLIVFYSVIISTALSIVANIISSYIQDQYNIITNEKRLIGVVAIFFLSIVASIIIQYIQKTKS